MKFVHRLRKAAGLGSALGLVFLPVLGGSQGIAAPGPNLDPQVLRRFFDGHEPLPSDFLPSPHLGPSLPQAPPAPDPQELWEELKAAPLDNRDREGAVRALFQKWGAAATDIQTFPIGDGFDDVYVVKKGSTDRLLFVGAHYDKVSKGHGVIDNWSGVVLVTQLYRELRDVPTQHTILFIAFGREEEGLVGSDAYANALPEQARRISDAMVNFDTFGRGGLIVAQNLTTPPLDRIAAQESLGMEDIDCGTSDQESFQRVGIPALMLTGFSCADMPILHSPQDNIGNFKPETFPRDIDLARRVVLRLDREWHRTTLTLTRARARRQ